MDLDPNKADKANDQGSTGSSSVPSEVTEARTLSRADPIKRYLLEITGILRIKFVPDLNLETCTIGLGCSPRDFVKSIKGLFYVVLPK